MRIASWKLWSIAAALALLISLWVAYAGLSDVAQNYLAVPLAFLPEHLQSWIKDTLIQRYPGPASFPFLLLAIRGFVNIGAVRSRLALFWPEPPVFLERQLERENSDPVGAYYPNQSFIGRTDDIEKLRAFGSGTNPVGHKWTTLSGRMSQGKTRLALEWLKQLQSEGWDAGVLNRNADLRPAKLSKMRLRKPVAIVIDEAHDQAELWTIIATLLRRAIACKRPIRILLVDQSILSVPAAFGDKEDARRNRKLVTDKAEKAQPGFRILCLDEDAAQELGKACGLSPQEIRDAEGRPGLLCLGKDARDELLRRAADRLDKTQSQEEKRLLALAALAGPFPAKSLPKDLSEIGLLTRARLFEGEVLNEGEIRINVRDTIPSLRPKPFAQGVLLHWAAGQQDEVLEALVEQAVELQPIRTGRALSRLLRQDWPEPLGDAAKRLAKFRPAASRESALAELSDLWNTQHELGESEDIEAMEDIHGEIADLAQQWPNDDAIVGVYAYALACRILHLNFGAGQALILQAMTNLKSMSEERFPHDAAIAHAYADALFSAARDIGKAVDVPDKWAHVQTYLKTLDELSTTRFTNDAAIALEYANALNNTVHDIGRAVDVPDRWARVQEYLKTLDQLSTTRFANDSAIALAYAKALFNAANDLGEAVDVPDKWARVQACLKTLDELSTARFADDPKVAFEYAKALFNATIQVPQSNPLGLFDRVRQDLAGLSRKWALNLEIQAFINEQTPAMSALSQQQAGWPYGGGPDG